MTRLACKIFGHRWLLSPEPVWHFYCHICKAVES